MTKTKMMKRNKKGMEREVIVGFIIAIILIAVGAYLINKHILGASTKVDTLGSCEAQKGDCVATREGCSTNNVFKVGCEGNSAGEWCCFKE